MKVEEINNKTNEAVSYWVNETAHEMLHKAERRTLTTKEVRETEAEAVAFVVCQSIGLKVHFATTSGYGMEIQAVTRELGGSAAHRCRDSRRNCP